MTMLPAERKRKIVDIISERNGASVAELAEEMSVSESTIRRDLKELDKEDSIRRSHGGALPMDQLATEPSFDQRSVQNQKAKQRIASRALDEIGENEIVFFDSGTTVFEVAKQVPKDGSFSAVTNSIELGFELGKDRGNLKITGGDQRNISRSLVGPVGERFLEDHHFDLLLLGTNAIDLENGLSTPNEQEGRMKRLMVEQSERIVLLADSSKLHRRSYVNFAGLDEIDVFITEESLTDEELDAFEQADVDVVDSLLD